MKYQHLVIFFISLLFSCSRSTNVYFYYPADAPSTHELEKLLQIYPLPEGILRAEDGTTSDTVRFRLEIIDWRTEAQSDGRLIRRIWFAPVAKIWDGISDAADHPENSKLKIVPLSSITPPTVALSDHNLYPGDPGYAWFVDTVLFLEYSDDFSVRNPDTKRAVEKWADTIIPEVESTDILRICAVGDIMPGRGTDTLLLAPGGLEKVFNDVLPILQSADLLLGNFEGAVTDGGTRTEKSYTFRFSPKILKPLKAAGFDYLSLTNNHSFDFGEEGFRDTLANFETSGIATSGVGIDLAEASVPFTAFLRGEDIRILSIGAYPRERNGFDGETETAATENRAGVLWYNGKTLDIIRSSFSDETFDILMVHGGEEWSTIPGDRQKQEYRSLAESGADLIIGSHPHVLHGMEAYQGTLIAYSLGNFVFPGMEETAYGEESGVLSIGLHEGTVKYFEFHPVRITGKTLSLDKSGEIKKRVLNQSELLN